MSTRCVLALVLAGATTIPAEVIGQVGHEPTRSPYRDIRIKQTLTLFGGYLSGGQGKAGVGPTDGPLGGVRWDLHVGSAAALFLGASVGGLERNLIRPTEPVDSRFIGTATQNVVIIDGGANLLLTGRKTWHGLAPYVGAALGVAIGQQVSADSSGFRFKTKFQAGPLLGFRFFFNRRTHLRVEGRDILWRLSYPDVFFQDFAPNDPDVGPVLDPVVNKQNEWTHHLTLMIGFGYSIRL